jgi:predicted nucleic acid-binding protein
VTRRRGSRLRCRQEVADGVDKYPHLRGVLDADWLHRREVSSPDEMNAFGKYTSRMLGEDQRKNLGECEVLALAEVHNGIAILDDAVARNAAQDYHVETRTTVALCAT